jgi:predicted enzyme related to lactoylglutathione lyase
MNRFLQVQLRTIDVAAAHAFYRGVIGDEAIQNAVPLHENAVARGARPHWLGQLEVNDVDRQAAAFASQGATPMGPKWVNPAGLEAAVMRDPGGALLALVKPPPDVARHRGGTGPAGVGIEPFWSILHTPDVERAKAVYAQLFGWEIKSPIDLGEHGVFFPFSFEKGGPAAGSITDIRSRPTVHPHWLFHFRVPAIDSAVVAVRAGGGKALGPFELPSGGRVAVCDDPQGAAFAIMT